MEVWMALKFIGRRVCYCIGGQYTLRWTNRTSGSSDKFRGKYIEHIHGFSITRITLCIAFVSFAMLAIHLTSIIRGSWMILNTYTSHWVSHHITSRYKCLYIGAGGDKRPFDLHRQFIRNVTERFQLFHVLTDTAQVPATNQQTNGLLLVCAPKPNDICLFIYVV